MKQRNFVFDSIVILSYAFISLLFEVVLFLFLGFGVFPVYMLFDFAAIAVICAILFIIPYPKTTISIATILLVLQAVVNCLNITLYGIFGDIFTIDMITLGNEAAAAFSLNYINWSGLIIHILLIAAFLIVSITSLKKIYIQTQFSRRMSLAIAFMFIVTLALGTGLFKIERNTIITTATYTQSEYFESDSYLLENLNVKYSALKKFGTFGLYIGDVLNALNFNNVDEASERAAAKSYIRNAKTLSELGQETSYHGISDNNNVIVIMVESLEWFAIDPHYTPNLYYLFENSLVFDQYYARNKTNVSEGIGILGSYPKNTQFTTFYKANESIGSLDLPFSLPNMLKDANENYVTSYFHNYYGYFYGRNMIMPSFGFDNAYFLENMPAYMDSSINPSGLPSEFSDFMLDSIMFTHSLENIARQDSPFYSHITTVTMHGGYTMNHPRIANNKNEIMNGFVNDYNRNYYSNTVFPEFGYNYTIPTNITDLDMFFNYKAAAMDTDKGIGILLNYLETTLDEFDTDGDGNTTESLLDNTTIVVYGDHNTYMTSLTNKMKGLSDTDLFTTELYRIPLMIYDAKVLDKFTSENGTSHFETYTNTFNIVPTLLDILGVDYFPAFYQGNSVFAEDYQVGFISIIGGIFDNNFFSYDTINILYRRDGATEAELKRFQLLANSFYAKQIELERIYKYNSFATK